MTTIHMSSTPTPNAARRKTNLAQEMKKKFTGFFNTNTFSSPLSDSTAQDDVKQAIKHAKQDNVPPSSAKPVAFTVGEPITDLQGHIQKLTKPVPSSGFTPRSAAYSEPDGYDIEYEALTNFDYQTRYMSGVFKAANKSCNVTKNRYKNVLANEGTRVRIKPKKVQTDEGEDETDYINANIIEGKAFGLDYLNYIATQAPLQNTLVDFWEMCYHQNISSIVILADEIQNEGDSQQSNNNDTAMKDDDEPETPSFTKKISFDDKYEHMLNSNRIHKYWPAAGQTIQYGDYRVTNMSKDEFSGCVDKDFQVRVLKIVCKAATELPPRFVIMYQYTSWPDMGVPKTPKSLERLIDLINLDLFQIPPVHIDCPPAPTALPCEAEKQQQQQTGPRPILVHCSAGVGRTGTFCTLQITLLQMLAHLKTNKQVPFKFSVYNTVKQLKAARYGMVQKKEQYVFCYTSILSLAQELGICKAQQQ